MRSRVMVNTQIWGWEKSYLRMPTILRGLYFEPSCQSLSTGSTLLQLLCASFPFLQVAFELTRVSWFFTSFHYKFNHWTSEIRGEKEPI